MQLISYLVLIAVTTAEIDKCIKKIFNGHEPQKVLHSFKEDIIEITNANSYSYIIMNYKQPPVVTFYKFDAYIIDHIGGFEEINEYIQLQSAVDNFNSKALFVIIVDVIDMTSIFKTLWKKFYISKVYVINKELEVYTIAPLSDGKCDDYTPVYVNNCYNYTLHHITWQFTGCPLRVHGVHVQPYVAGDIGLEVDIIKVVAAKLEMVAILNTNNSDFGKRLSNGTYTNLFQKLYNRETDVLIGGGCLDYLGANFDFTYPHLSIHYSFYILKEGPIDPGHNTIHAFEVDLWLGIGVSLVLLPLVLFALTRCENGLQLSTCALYVFAIFINSCSWTPIRAYNRLIFLSWAWAAFILKVSYESLLISHLITVAYEQDITTLDQLIETEAKLCMSERAIQYFRYDNEVVFKKAQATSLQGDECIEWILQEKDYALLADARVIKYKYTHESSPLYPLEGHFINLNTMHLAKGSPFTEKINSLIWGIVEMGLFEKWGASPKIHNDRLHEKEHRHIETINMNHVKSILMIYGLGVAFAVLVFLIECCYFHIVLAALKTGVKT